jgi:hypothetical protein
VSLNVELTSRLAPLIFWKPLLGEVVERQTW